MNCSDLSADIFTTGVAIIGQTTNSNFELCDTEDQSFDTDWHRVNLTYGTTYRFELDFDGSSSPTIPATLSLHDRLGNEIGSLQRNDDLTFDYTAQTSGQFFVSAFQGSVLSGTEYDLNIDRLFADDISEGQNIQLFDGFSTLDQIESIGDTDTFDFDVSGGRDYLFLAGGTSLGGTLPSPTLELFRDGTLIGSGAGFIEYSSSAFEELQVVVGGSGDTGSYAVLGLVVDEAAGNTTTTSNLTFDENELASTRGYISEFSDFDWHRVSLNAGDIVRVTLRSFGTEALLTPQLVFRDPSLNVIHGEGVNTVSRDGGRIDYFYEVEQSGDHYVVARTRLADQNGEYLFEVENIRTPAVPNNLFGRGATSRLIVDDGAAVPLADLLDLQGLEPDAFEVFAPFPLLRDGNWFAPNRSYVIPAADIGLWTLDDEWIDQSSDFLFRALVSNRWSEWRKFDVADANIPEGLVSNNQWDVNETITYQFVTGLPSDYTEGEFGTLSAIPLNSNLARSIAGTFSDVSQVTGLNLALQSPAQFADINIFLADDTPGAYLAFAPGAQRGGDIILNSNFFDTGGDLNAVTQFFAQQAVASSLGLNFVSNVDRIDSILGDGQQPSGNLPANLSAGDWLALQEIYGSRLRDPSDEIATLVNIELSADPVISTIAHEARGIVVANELQQHDFTIDLRDQGRSLVRDPEVTASEIVVGVGATVLNATGGNGNDFLFGNGAINTLTGNAGDDFLTGGVNDDRLNGGAGDDFYAYNIGDGNDFVADISGIDTIAFFGQPQFEIDNLAEDFLFSRTGQFLEINLTLDGGESEGSIRIDTGFSETQVVETLQLWQQGESSPRQTISLFNLFSSLDDGQTSSFSIIPNRSDNFGSLVQAV